MKWFKKGGVVLALVMAITASAWANAAYTVVNSAYSTGKAGTVASSTGTVNQNATAALSGAPKAYWFADANGQSRVLVFRYNNGAAAQAVIYNPATTPWTTVATRSWSGITNVYGVAKLGSYLYAVDYNSAKIAKINMTGNNYGVVATYQYTRPGYEAHGMAITVVGNYVYGLFMAATNPWAPNPNYQPSQVVKFNANLGVVASTPITGTATVGKNAFTLKPYNNNLYVACIGGKQNNNEAYNSESRLNVVNLTNMSVTTPLKAGTALPYDFLDITFNSTGAAYILVGKYTADFTMQGKVYKTTADDITSGNIGTLKETISNKGFEWALLYENSADRLWLAKGNQIDLRVGSTYALIKSLPASALGGTTYPNLNSVTILGQTATLQGYQAPLPASNMKAVRKVEQQTK